MDFDDCLHEQVYENEEGKVEYCEDCGGSRRLDIKPYEDNSNDHLEKRNDD